MPTLFLFLKGFLMGAVELIPGVSAGTIALVTGIYTELIDSLKSINLQALKTLRQQGLAAAWRSINGTFLLTLVLGMALALLSLARLIQYLLEHYGVYCWAFFFGLILAASWYVGKTIQQWNFQRVLWLSLGLGLMVLLFTQAPASISITPLNLVVAGAIAISAMLLPGVSGSFMLVLMGVYQPVLAALNALEITTLSYFVLGLVLGLLTFTRLLSWLLHHYREAMMAFLTGVMLGSLVKIWPWKTLVLSGIDRHGKVIALLEKNIVPALNLEIGLALALAIMGATLVLLLEWLAKKLK